MGASNRSISIPVSGEEKQKKREKGKGARGRLAGLAAGLLPRAGPKAALLLFLFFCFFSFSFFYFVISLKIETKLFGFGYFQICKLLNHVPRCLATQNNLFGVI
jgi:hypothetical protein